MTSPRGARGLTRERLSMSTSTIEDSNIALAKEYFIRGDARRPDLLELFHPDFQLYFPKFGIGRGPESFLQMVSGFAGELESIEHDFSSYTFIAKGSYVVVEGTTRGRMKGQSWTAGETPGGGVCNVLEFPHHLITL